MVWSELPAATTVTTPESIALLTAIDVGSSGLLLSSPNDKLITFIPSEMDLSIAAIIPELSPLPYGPSTR